MWEMIYLSKNSIFFTWFLAMAVALGPLATDMYLPSFPLLGQFFGISPVTVQWTLSIFVIGIAVFQLIVGPLSDRFGRKNILLLGLTLFVIASLVATQVASIEGLMVARLLQSIGVCIAIVIPRAMVRDLFEREMSAKKLSRIGTLMGLAPAISPIIGGYLTVRFGWDAVFLFLAGYGVLAILITLIFVPESLKDKDHLAMRPLNLIANYRDLLSSPVYLRYALTAAFCFAGFFAYISASSYILINLLRITVDQFGYYFGAVVLGYIGGTVLGPKLTAYKNLDWALKFGTSLSLVGGTGLFVLCLTGILHPVAIILPMFCYNIGVGVVVPQCQAAAMHPFPEKAGAASALNGFLMLGLSAIVGFLVANFYAGTPLPMSLAVFTLGGASFLCCRLKINASTALAKSMSDG